MKKAPKDEVERLRRMYGTLVEVNRAAVRAGSVDELLERVCRIAVQRAGLEFAWAGRVMGRRVKPLFFHGGSPAHIRAGIPAAIAAVQKGKAVVEPQEEDSRLRCAAVPVYIAEDTAVAFAFCSSEPEFFSGSGREFFEQLAGDVSSGVEHLRMRNEIEYRLQRLKRFGDALREFNEEAGATGERLQRIVRRTAACLGVDRAGVWVFSEDGSKLVCRVMYLREDDRFAESHVLECDSFPEYFKALGEGKTVASEDAAGDPEVKKLAGRYPAEAGAKALINVPVRAGGRVLGVLCCEHGKARKWLPEEREFIASVAGVVSHVLRGHETRKRLRKLSLFPEKNPNPVFMVGRNGEILYRNPAVLKYVPAPGEVSKLLPENITRLAMRACDTGRVLKAEHSFRGRYFEYTISPVSEDAANVYGREITDVKRAQEELGRYAGELEKSQRALLNILEDEQEAVKKLEEAYRELKTLDQLKSDIIANVSHELRTPMTIAKGFAELALDERDEEERRRNILRVIRALENQNVIIGNLITVAEASREKLKLQVSSFPVRELIKAALDRKRDEIKSRGLMLEVEIEDCEVAGDLRRLTSVLSNILDNAIKFNRPGGEIRVEVRRGRGNVLITVSDTGIGIPGDVMPKIFDPLYQADATARRRYGGTGMGLAVARIVVEAHGGEIYASSSPGKGSRFTVVLPSGGFKDEKGAGG